MNDWRSRPLKVFALILFGSSAAWIASASAAVHAGGVAACSYCHVMHESKDGQLVPAEGALLRGASSSDVCLNCHSGMATASVLGMSPLNPAPLFGGGDFAFLLEDNLNDAPNGATQVIGGEAAGHSVVAPSQGLVAESRWSVAPGGSFPSSDLGCTSCHDPHGGGNFRMLYGVGPVQGGVFQFSRPAPMGLGVDLDGPGESATNHTAYLSGWEDWCGNCHGDQYHDRSRVRFEHPNGESLESEVRDRYSVYSGDANPNGGNFASSYLPEVAFEEVTMTVSGTSGPESSSRLSCVTCHRAHASSAPAALRWDGRARTLGEDGVVSGSYALPNPYLDSAQRALCVKCHDEDHGQGRGCLSCHAAANGGGGHDIFHGD